MCNYSHTLLSHVHIAHRTLLIAHCSSHIAHHTLSSHIGHRTLLIAHWSSHIAHRTLVIAHCSSHIVITHCHRTLVIAHCSSHIVIAHCHRTLLIAVPTRNDIFRSRRGIFNRQGTNADLLQHLVKIVGKDGVLGGLRKWCHYTHVVQKI
jgi:hypothetical protein